MSKKVFYEINKNIDMLFNRGYSNFLDPYIFKHISSKLKKFEYYVFYPYNDSDKVIIYSYKKPLIKLFKIKCNDLLTHSMILGSLYGLNISSDMFGDIIVDGYKYYIYLMEDVSTFVLNNLTRIGSKSVQLVEIDSSSLTDYQKKFEDYSSIVSSLRIDNVISTITGLSRTKVKEKISNDEVLLNYDVLSNGSYQLKDNDVFSVRRYGKFKFINVKGTTKKDNYIINYIKYI